jgi:hypothetical protein
MISSTTSIERTRHALALAAGLSHSGDRAQTRSVALRLGVDENEARLLFELLLASGGDEPLSTRLPLAPNAHDGIANTASIAHPTAIKALRLLPEEAQSLAAAFDWLGLDGGNELRKSIERCYFPLTAEDGGHIKAPQVAPTVDITATLDDLSQALLADLALAFVYRPAQVSGEASFSRDDAALQGEDTPPAPLRHVRPLALRHERERWYLDAFDLDRQAQRCFRVDRMSELVTFDASDLPLPASISAGSGLPYAEVSPLRMVNLTFADRETLERFDWPGLEVMGHGQGRINCQIPWYPQRDWLPRHLAACGSRVRIYDEQLKAEVRRYAQQFLGEVAD